MGFNKRVTNSKPGAVRIAVPYTRLNTQPGCTELLQIMFVDLNIDVIIKPRFTKKEKYCLSILSGSVSLVLNFVAACSDHSLAN